MDDPAPVSFCTQWRGDFLSKKGRMLDIPLYAGDIHNIERIFRKQTKVGQLVEIYKSCCGNTSVLIDGNYQLGVAYDGIEPSYGDDAHRTYLNVLQFNKVTLKEQKILIIGGGDLGLACLLLDNGAEDIMQFELDPELVEILAEYIPSVTQKGLDDPRIKIKYGDGFAALESCGDDTFDIIIGDLTRSAATKFGDRDVHSELIRVCKSSGIIMSHWAEGDIDLNSIFSSFYGEDSPKFFCNVESSPDTRIVWSPSPIDGVEYSAPPSSRPPWKPDPILESPSAPGGSWVQVKANEID